MLKNIIQIDALRDFIFLRSQKFLFVQEKKAVLWSGDQNYILFISKKIIFNFLEKQATLSTNLTENEMMRTRNPMRAERDQNRFLKFFLDNYASSWI